MRTTKVVVILPLLLTLAMSVQAWAQIRKMETVALDFWESTQPAFDLSPDGRTILLDLLGQLWRMPADGGDAHPLTDAVRDTAEDLEPVMSPDGRWIAFLSDRPTGRGLWLIPSDGGVPRLLVRADNDRLWPAWSHDGTRIAFVRGSSLGFVTVATGVIREYRITGLPSPPLREPIWAADGRHILFVNAQRNTSLGGALWQVSDTGGAASRVFSADLRMNAPALSQDGRLAFFVRDSLGVHQLWIADSLGATPRRLTSHDDTTPLRVRWTPDGKRLIYHADGQLWRLNVAEGGEVNASAAPTAPNRIPLHATLSVPRSTWRPPAVRFPTPGQTVQARGFRGIGLSPDGERIALIALDSLWIFRPHERPRAIVGVPHDADDVAWSPDSREVAWSAGRERDLFVTHIERRTTRQLTALPDDEFRPSWSGDGRWIAFLHGPPGWREQRVRVVRADSPTPISSVDSTRDIGRDPNGRYLSSDNLGQEVPQWSATSRAVAFLEAGSRSLIWSGIESRGDTTSRPLRNATFVRLLGDTTLVFIRNNQLWWARFRSDSGVIGAPRRLSGDAAAYPSVSRNGTVLYVSSDGLRLRPPNGIEQHLGWPLSFRAESAPPLLLRNVRVLDVNAGRTSPPRDILLRSGRIERIAALGAIERSARLRMLDAGGRIAIPGLIDLHQHFWDDVQPAGLLHNGVTTARDVGSAPARTRALRDAIDAGVRRGPRVRFAGFFVHTADADNGFSGQQEQAVTDEGSLTRALDLTRAFGADYLKLYQFSRWVGGVSAIRLAHERGLRVTGHVAHPLPFIAAGMDGKEHVGRAGGYHRLDSFLYDDIVQLFRGAHVAVVPTIAFFSAAARLYDDSTLLAADDAKQFLSPYLRFHAANMPSPTRTPAQRRSWQRTSDITRAATRRLYEGRVRIGTGTDTPHLAWGLHLELEELVASGLTPAAALRAATSDAAAIVGSDEIGVISTGKLADIVLLDADPLANIRNTRRIWRVIKNGRVYER